MGRSVKILACGVAMVRVHDVRACCDASRLVAAASGELDRPAILERAVYAEGAA